MSHQLFWITAESIQKTLFFSQANIFSAIASVQGINPLFCISCLGESNTNINNIQKIKIINPVVNPNQYLRIKFIIFLFGLFFALPTLLNKLIPLMYLPQKLPLPDTQPHCTLIPCAKLLQQHP